MNKLKLLFFIYLFMRVTVVNASMVTVDEQDPEKNTVWISHSFKEERKDNEEVFSFSSRGHHDDEDEWKEKQHIDFDRDDRWGHDLKNCDKPPAVPIPGSAWLFLSGIAGLVGMAKRKAK